MLTSLNVLAAAAAHGAEKKAGLPQLNPADFSPQLIWLALTFGVLYLVLSRVALPRIGEVIEERRDRIQRDLDAAERMRADTDAALKAYEQSLADARTRAGGIAKETRDRLSAEVDGERGKVEAQIKAKLVDAETRIAATKAKALASVSEIASDTAGAVVGKLLGTSATPDEIKKALQAVAGK